MNEKLIDDLVAYLCSIVAWLEMNGHIFAANQDRGHHHFACDACRRLTEAQRLIDITNAQRIPAEREIRGES